jgi:hypothetical protein
MLQSGEFIAQSVLDDFLKVALNDEVTGLHQIRTIQTDFCTLLTRQGWTACHQRYFHTKMKVKKYRFERKPALDFPILIAPILFLATMLPSYLSVSQMVKLSLGTLIQ